MARRSRPEGGFPLGPMGFDRGFLYSRHWYRLRTVRSVDGYRYSEVDGLGWGKGAQCLAERLAVEIGFIIGGGGDATFQQWAWRRRFDCGFLLIDARAMLQAQLRSPVRVNECLATTCNRTITSKRRKLSMVQTSANALRKYAALNRRE